MRPEERQNSETSPTDSRLFMAVRADRSNKSLKAEAGPIAVDRTVVGDSWGEDPERWDGMS